MPAEEALYLGAPLAHVRDRNEHMRRARIDQQSREAIARLGRYARAAF